MQASPGALSDLYYSDMLSKANRTKLFNFIQKVFDNIIENPDEEKYRRIKKAAILKKFQKWYVPEKGIAFLESAGFETVKGELVLQDVQNVVDMKQQIIDFIEDEPNRLAQEREKVQEKAKERVRNDSFIQKRAETKKNVTANMKDQVQQMKEGTYHIGKNIHERKGGI